MRKFDPNPNDPPSLPSRESIEKDTKVGKLIGGFRERIRNVFSLEALFSGVREKISRGVQKVMGWFRKPRSESLPPRQEQPEDSSEDFSAEPMNNDEIKEKEKDTNWKEADAGLEKHMEDMTKDYISLQNSFRAKLNKSTPFASKCPELEVVEELNIEAKKIARTLASQGKVEHSTEEYRKNHKIDGEILTSGFPTPQKALQAFINSRSHYTCLAGTFQKCGAAIAAGRDGKYYLVVLFRGGIAHRDEKELPEVSSSQEEISEDKEDKEKTSNFIIFDLKPDLSPLLKMESFDDCIKDRSVLKRHFAALDKELLSRKPEIAINYKYINTVSTKQLQRHFPGAFCLNVEIAGKAFQYQVFAEPPSFHRIENHDGVMKTVVIPFSQFIDDVISQANKDSKTSDSDNDPQDISDEDVTPAIAA